MTRSIFTKRYAVLCRLLLEAREAAGMTQAALARRLGRPQSYVSKVEHGERRVDVVEFVELCEAIGADAAGMVERLRAVAGARSASAGRTGIRRPRD